MSKKRGSSMPSDQSVESMINQWEEFFEENDYTNRIAEVADAYPDEKTLYVDFADLNRHSSEMVDYLLEHPNNAIYAARQAILKLIPPIGKRVRIHFRIKNMPRDKTVRIEIRDLRSKHLGKFVSIEGLVRKATEVRPKVTDASFECLRCGKIIKMPQEGMSFQEPLECSKDQGGCGRAAGTTRFRLLVEESAFVDTQKVELQESPEGLRGGSQPQRLVAFVEDDITGFISPGDRLVLNGTLRTTQKGVGPAKSTLFDIFLDVNSIEVEEHEFEDVEITPEDVEEIKALVNDEGIFRKITASISPTIYGMNVEKEALALQLFGGVAKSMPDGTKIRGDIHILLIGDPGTAKSQLLRYMAQLAPRGIYASGKSSSAAGLTAAAVKDEFGEGRWTLEAGALVLADKGIACIDELDKMSPQDRSSMHEAMEQQTVSVAKAGITATLQSRCAMLGAANPKFGRFEETRYISEQIDLPPALLSRFDIIFSITDKPDSKIDRMIAEHILKAHLVGEVSKRMEFEDVGDEYEIEDETRSMEPWFGPEFLRKYVAYAKRIYPVMTEEAMSCLKEYYVTIRKQGEAEGSSVPITARQLEAFVRLAEASARARLSGTVAIDDAERAVRIVEYYLRKVAGEGGHFDIDIIATGTSHSQRDQMTILRRIISDLSDSETGVSAEEITDHASREGIPRDRVRSLLTKLSNGGEIFSPKAGHYKLA